MTPLSKDSLPTQWGTMKLLPACCCFEALTLRGSSQGQVWQLVAPGQKVPSSLSRHPQTSNPTHTACELEHSSLLILKARPHHSTVHCLTKLTVTLQGTGLTRVALSTISVTVQGLHSEGVYLIEHHLKSLNNLGALLLLEGKGRKRGWMVGKSGRAILNNGLSQPHS